MRRLGAFGLRTVVDFRLPGEVLVGGEDRLPAGATRSPAVTGGDLGVFYDLIASETTGSSRRSSARGGPPSSCWAAPRFVADQHRVRDAVRMIADASMGLPLLYHCRAQTGPGG